MFINNNNNVIKVNCKRCGRPAVSTEFVLDPIYGMLVCPTCIKERKSGVAKAEIQQNKNKQQEQANVQAAAKNKPAGWDKEDDFLERSYKNKQDSTKAATVEKIDDQRVKYRCTKCQFKFTYDFIRKYPGTCPYCQTPVLFSPNNL